MKNEPVWFTISLIESDGDQRALASFDRVSLYGYLQYWQIELASVWRRTDEMVRDLI
jgi:hypothetical protein